MAQATGTSGPEWGSWDTFSSIVSVRTWNCGCTVIATSIVGLIVFAGFSSTTWRVAGWNALSERAWFSGRSSSGIHRDHLVKHSSLPLPGRCSSRSLTRFANATCVNSEARTRLRRTSTEHVRNFLRIPGAAEYLGISPNALRNREDAGRITAHRHHVNGCRLFTKEEPGALLKQLQEPRPAPGKR